MVDKGKEENKRGRDKGIRKLMNGKGLREKESLNSVII